MSIFDFFRKKREEITPPLRDSFSILRDNVDEARRQVVNLSEKTPVIPFLPAEKFSNADLLRTGRDILQSITRGAARTTMGAGDVLRTIDERPSTLFKAGLDFIKTGRIPMVEGPEPTELKLDPQASRLEKSFFRGVFGTDRVSGWAEAIAKKELEPEPIPFLGERGKNLVLPVVLATAPLDFTGFGGGEKGFVRLLTETKDPVAIARLMEKAGIGKDLIGSFEGFMNYAEGFARADSKAKVEEGLNALKKFIETTSPGARIPKGIRIGEEVAGDARLLENQIKSNEEQVKALVKAAAEKGKRLDRYDQDEILRLNKETKVLKEQIKNIPSGPVTEKAPAVAQQALEGMAPTKAAVPGQAPEAARPAVEAVTPKIESPVIREAKHILQNNAFNKNEVSYYMGQSGKNPHGIPDSVWQKVSKELGFEPKNLEEINGKLFLKESTETDRAVTDLAKPAVEGAKPVAETAEAAAPALGKERGFITSVKESYNVPPETKKLIETLPGGQKYYDVLTDATAVADAQARIAKDGLDRSLSYVMSAKDIDKNVVTTGIELMRNYRMAGDYKMEAEVAGYLAERATKAGQAVQAFSILDKLSPEGVLVYATKRLREGVAPEKIRELDRLTEDVVTKLKDANTEVADEVVKKLETLPEIKKVKSINETEEAAERLKDRINVVEKEVKVDPVKDMVNTLYKVAQELLPAKKVKPPRNQIELIEQAIKNKSLYEEVWIKAQELVKEKYADDEKSLELLDDYFNALLDQPFSKKQLTTAVKQGIKGAEINLGKLAREHFSTVGATRDELARSLTANLNISPEEAAGLTIKIQGEFDKLIKIKRESILNNIFKERTVSDKTLIDKMLEWANLGAFDSEKFRPLIAQKLGIPSLSEALARDLVAQANKIQSLPWGYEKMKETQNLAEMINREIPWTRGAKIYNLMAELANIPRSVMSSFFDFSFGLRQGLVAMWRHPKDFIEAFKSQFGAFGSEAGYETLMDTVLKHPKFRQAVDSGVAFSDINTKLSLREERYMSSLAEKMSWKTGTPGVGRLIRSTNRAYTGMANKLRMDTFSTLVDSFEQMGQATPENVKMIAELVNDMTGRGTMLESLERAAPLLNAFFYSPRLMASRINLLNPLGKGNGYLLQSPAIRKEYLKTMLAFTAGTSTVLGLASLIPGVDVGIDPRNADFAKIKFGNTRIDIAGGMQQYIRILSQIASGKYISSSTGKIITLGEGYKPLTRGQVALRGLESKEAPIFSLITDWFRGVDAEGKKFSLPKEVLNRLTPMLMSDIVDLYKDDPRLLPLGILGTFGVGLQTYAPPEAYQKLEELRKAPDRAKAWAELQKSNPALAKKVERAGIESTFNEFDWGLTYMGVENGQRAQFLYHQLQGLPDNEARLKLWNDLKGKKLLSKDVEEQIKWIYAHPDYLNAQ